MSTRSRNKRNPATLFINDFFHHQLDAMRLCYKQLRQTPVASFMTFAVIAIALALPAWLFVVLQNLKSVSTNWNEGTQISLFLNQNIAQQELHHLLGSVKSLPQVAKVHYISPEKGLLDLQQQTGMVPDILNELPNNPLPPVIEVRPNAAQITNPAQAANLVQELQNFPGVASAKLDMEWVQKLFSIIKLAQHGVESLVILLALGVILVISNTIRLATQSRYKEIEILKLIGASNRYIRRPFLYTGAAYGLGGGILAWILVWILIVWLAAPITHLAALYHTQFSLQNLHGFYGLSLLMLSMLLGWLGSWLALSRYTKS